MHPFRDPGVRPPPERDSSPRALAKGDRVRVVAAEPDSDPVVRRHGCEAGTVDHVFHGTGAASVRLDTGASWLFLREWLIALDA